MVPTRALLGVVPVYFGGKAEAQLKEENAVKEINLGLEKEEIKKSKRIWMTNKPMGKGKW